jgi:hypothetical protein
MPLPSVYRHWSPSPVGDVRDTDGDSPRNEAETNRLRIVGQMFAYLGVLTLFVGSVLVLLGHFGNLANYSPTGWIIATAGQMLLFLGGNWTASHPMPVHRAQQLERWHASGEYARILRGDYARETIETTATQA